MSVCAIGEITEFSRLSLLESVETRDARLCLRRRDPASGHLVVPLLPFILFPTARSIVYFCSLGVICADVFNHGFRAKEGSLVFDLFFYSFLFFIFFYYHLSFPFFCMSRHGRLQFYLLTKPIYTATHTVSAIGDRNSERATSGESSGQQAVRQGAQHDPVEHRMASQSVFLCFSVLLRLSHPEGSRKTVATIGSVLQQSQEATNGRQNKAVLIAHHNALGFCRWSMELWGDVSWVDEMGILRRDGSPIWTQFTQSTQSTQFIICNVFRGANPEPHEADQDGHHREWPRLPC